MFEETRGGGNSVTETSEHSRMRGFGKHLNHPFVVHPLAFCQGSVWPSPRMSSWRKPSATLSRLAPS
eukprot:10952542-Heterocapsa_arctica.AAC.1